MDGDSAGNADGVGDRAFCVWELLDAAGARVLAGDGTAVDLGGMGYDRDDEVEHVQRQRRSDQWAAHDLAHLVQINRVMAKRYKDEVGPWAAYLSVMK